MLLYGPDAFLPAKHLIIKILVQIIASAGLVKGAVKRLLIIEDEESITDVLKRLAEADLLGVEVVVAKKLEEAMKHLGKEKFHFVWTDDRFPEKEGHGLG